MSLFCLCFSVTCMTALRPRLCPALAGCPTHLQQFCFVLCDLGPHRLISPVIALARLSAESILTSMLLKTISISSHLRPLPATFSEGPGYTRPSVRAYGRHRLCLGPSASSLMPAMTSPIMLSLSFSAGTHPSPSGQIRTEKPPGDGMAMMRTKIVLSAT